MKSKSTAKKAAKKIKKKKTEKLNKGDKALLLTDKQEISLSVPQVTESILIDYIAGSGAKNLSTIQKKLFVETAKGFNLNPLKREVYAIAYQNRDGGYDMSIITGYEVYLKRAERSGKLFGWKVWAEGKGNDLKACINIWRKDFREPVYHEVYLREYNTGKSLWVKKPITMIKKVAIAQGFRLAFPDELGGVPYTADELPENMTNITPSKTDKPQEPQPASTPAPETPNETINAGTVPAGASPKQPAPKPASVPPVKSSIRELKFKQLTKMKEALYKRDQVKYVPAFFANFVGTTYGVATEDEMTDVNLSDFIKEMSVEFNNLNKKGA